MQLGKWCSMLTYTCVYRHTSTCACGLGVFCSWLFVICCLNRKMNKPVYFFRMYIKIESQNSICYAYLYYGLFILLT